MNKFADKYDWIGEFNQGIAIFKKNGKFGAVLIGGKEIIPPVYDALSNFENGYATAQFNYLGCKSNEKRIINLSGQVQVNKENENIFLPDLYDWGYNYVDNLCVVIKNNKCGVIDEEGNMIIPVGKYEAIKVISNNIIVVAAESYVEKVKCIDVSSMKEYTKNTRRFSKWGIIDSKGKQIVPCKYPVIKVNCYDTFYVISINDNEEFRYGILNKNGEIMYPFNFTYFGKFKFIYIYSYNANIMTPKVNVVGKIDLSTINQSTRPKNAKEEHHKESEENEFGFKTGHVCAEVQNIAQEEVDFRDYRAEYDSRFFQKNSTFGFIDTKLTILTNPIYEIIDANDYYIKVCKEGKLGVLNFQGKEIVKIGEYDYVELDKRGLVIVAKEPFNSDKGHANGDKEGFSKWGVVDSNGDEIVFCGYSAVSIVDGPYILACETIPIDDIYNGREFEDEDDREYYNWVKRSESNPSFGLWEIFNKEGDTILEGIEGGVDDAQAALDCFLNNSDSDEPECCGRRYSKYGGYNGWDDDAIDEAFDGDPELTWNVD